jgi:hypothetical protein
MTQDELKTQVGQAALQYVVKGEIVGVGTGSTVNKFIDALASIKNDIEGAVSSSVASTERLLALGIPVFDCNEVTGLHRRRRRDRPRRQHDQGRRRSADARENCRQHCQAFCLHCR